VTILNKVINGFSTNLITCKRKLAFGRLFLYIKVLKIKVMTLKKKVTSKFLVGLRRIGLISKKPIQKTKFIKISKTVYPNGYSQDHYRITQTPLNPNSLESEIHVYNLIKESVKG
jgi:hypothetical protein